MARVLGCSEKFGRRQVAAGNIGYFKIGSDLRFLPDDVDRYIACTHREPVA